ncbi:MAG: hypothetical protein EAZ12_00685 [Sphingobacteriia bacterium]|nr:MAG: hypothetical protein EAZ12_00685 [Sphingobacteriia bacterium]
MRRKTILILFILGSWISSKAQLMESFVHTGELGIGVGVGHYFGDLNPDARINAPKMAFGIFYRKQISNYIGIRITGEYSFLGYSDIYSNNPVDRKRNLSFNSNVWELGIAGDFNFFRFQPGFEGYNFTPYMGLGIGVFTYDPFTYLNGEKYLLRPLGTEGQGSALYPNSNPYSITALSIPFTFGVKYALNPRTNFFAEVMYRFTNTDYLDDVSGLYAPDAFPPLPDGSLTPAFLLQDRSYETGSSIGVKGKQRGNSLKKDSFITLKVGLSFNLQTYRCPTN